MRKGLLTIAFTFVVKVLLSQTFAPEGSYWRYCSYNWPTGTYSPSYFNVESRDTINGKEIITMSGSASNLLYGSPYRFHVSGDSTFVFSNTDSTLTLLFNFSFQQGDTMHFNEKNSLRMYGSHEETDYARFVVDSVGTVNMQGNNLRFYTMKYDNVSVNFELGEELSTRRFIVVEKIGLMQEFIVPTFYGDIWDGDYPMLFYYTNTSTPNLYGDSTNTCLLRVDEDELLSSQVFPNPTSDILYISSPYIENVYADITDMQGRKIKNSILLPASTTTSVQLGELAPGIYVLSVSLSTGNVYSRKIVKQ